MTCTASFVYPIEWMDIKLAVAVDFGSRQDPLAPVWIHFHTIDSHDAATAAAAKNAGTKDFENIHAIHEQLGFGSMITHSYQEYQYLLNVVELPVTFIDEKYLPKILSKQACCSTTTTTTTTTTSSSTTTTINPKKHSWMITEEDEFNSNWNEYNAPNAYYRSYRLARQMEHLKKNKVIVRNTSYDMNNDLVEKDNKSEQQQEICKLFENMQFKLTVS